MKRNIMLLFRESFIPVMVVIVLIFVLLLYVQYKSVIEADQVSLIEIQSINPMLNLDSTDDEASTEVDVIYTSRSDDPTHIEAEKLVAKGRLSDAEALYKKRLAKQRSSEVYNDLGVLYHKMGEDQKALKQFNIAIKTKPVYVSAYFNRGVVNSTLERYAQAADDYHALLREIPNHFEAQYNLGVSYLRQKEFPMAAQAFKKAAVLAGGQRKARALYNLGISYKAIDSDKSYAARNAFESAIRIKPDYLEARIGLLTLEPATEQGYQNMHAQLDKILSIKPGFALAHFHRALVYSKQGKVKKAVRSYEEAIKYNPEYSKARYNYGLLMLNDKQLNKAREQFEWILERSPNHVHSIFNLGRVAYAQKKYPEALKHYYTAIDLMRGDYPEAYLNAGLVHSAKNEYELAVQAYEEALRLRPQYPEAWYNLGLIHLRHKQYEKAVDAFRTAIENDPNYYRAWYNLGFIYSRQDKNDLAMEAYRNAIDIHPNYQKAKLNLAIRYAKQNRYTDAATLYMEVLNDDDSNILAWYNLGIAYSETRDFDAAEEAFLNVIKLDPDNMKSRRSLAHLMVDIEKYDEAIEYLQQAIDIQPSNYDLHIELGQTLAKAGYGQESKVAYEKAKLLKQNVKTDIASDDERNR
jgi:tetratricopeptide (TPR) repeat protein